MNRPAQFTQGDLKTGAQLFDAIIIGAGATGSYAARLLTQAGLNVCLLDAGWPKPAWQRPYQTVLGTILRTGAMMNVHQRFSSLALNKVRGLVRRAGRLRQPVQSQCYAWELNPDAFVDDKDHPYYLSGETDFRWIRARGAGGRMVAPEHGLHFWRLSRSAFSAEVGASFPIDPQDMDAWYQDAETALGLSVGADEAFSDFPARGLEVRRPSASEDALMKRLRAAMPKADLRLSRTAAWKDFLAPADASGRLTLFKGAVAHRLNVSPNGNRVRGVSAIDAATRQELHFEAPLVFVCASALESTRLLMMSASRPHPNGIGNHSDALGRYLMDHILMGGQGHGPAIGPEAAFARQGHSVTMGRAPKDDFSIQMYYQAPNARSGHFNAVSFGAMQPRADNRITLHPLARDVHGLPVLSFECRHDERDLATATRQRDKLLEIGCALGVEYYMLNKKPEPMGASIHECGTARMGFDPDNSVLDPSNQVWGVNGLYVTDGAAFPVQDVYNPTLTMMALTARAAAHATGARARRKAPGAEPAADLIA